MCKEIVKVGGGEKVLVIWFDVFLCGKIKSPKSPHTVEIHCMFRDKELMKMGIFWGVAEG